MGSLEQASESLGYCTQGDLNLEKFRCNSDQLARMHSRGGHSTCSEANEDPFPLRQLDCAVSTGCCFSGTQSYELQSNLRKGGLYRGFYWGLL